MGFHHYVHGPRLIPRLMGGIAGGAAALLASETDGLAFDFTDQSARIKDVATPANEYDSQGHVRAGALAGPGGKLVYASPTNKICRQRDGLWKYQAHNRYLNSASPANQTVTVVTSATYAVTITGTVTMTASNAATGTWTAGTTTFTAASTTLTLGSTSGSGTVHLRRTPSVDTYIATAGAIVYDLPYEWDEYGNCLGILVESQRINICLRASDFTNAAWTKSNLTAAKTATGADGEANSASTLTATAANATALQAITSASAARITYCWIKRRTGTGNIDLTQDNGSTWTTVTVTSSWTRVALASVTSTDPTVGIRIVTSGDEVDVMWFNHVGSVAYATSPIQTFAGTVTRAGDNISIATSEFPLSATEMTLATFAEVGPGSNLVAVEIQAASRGDALTNFTQTAVASTFSGSGAAFASQHLITHTPLPVGTASRLSGRAKANDFQSARNGTLAAADTSGLFQPTAYAKIAIGSIGSTFCTDAHIREVVYLPRIASDADLKLFSLPRKAAEKAASVHIIGDSFATGINLTQHLGLYLNNKIRTISNDGVGGSTLADQKTRFDSTSQHYDSVLVIMDGGLTDTPAAAQTATQGMIANLTHSRWLYVQSGLDIATRSAGMALRTDIDTINAWVLATYPNNYVATKTIMQSYSTGDANDLADLAADVWPRSQTSDGLHPTATGYANLADIIIDAILAKGW
jgi:hypothetical protein